MPLGRVGQGPLIGKFDERGTAIGDANETQRRRQELRRRYGAAYQLLSSILFAEDPIGINYEKNTHEYDPEVGTILPRLHGCRSVDDVRRIVREEFVRWFDVGTAGPPEEYQVIATRIWHEVMPALPE